MAKKAPDPAESKVPTKTEPAPAVLKERTKWMSKLQDLGFAADCTQDAYRDSIQTPSPQFNFALGCGSRTGRHGIPRGFSALFGGHPKGGKTAAIYATIGQLHQDDPEAFVIRFDTELKESAAMTPDQLRMWGIDPTRYICYETNSPDEIFDRIRYGIAEMVEAGLPLALVVIDSVNEISGKRAAIAEAGVGSGKKPSILNWSLGDHAAILQEGFKVILPFLRRNRVACILTCHVGAEFDEQAKMRDEWKLKVAKGLQHQVEIWLTMNKIESQAGKRSAVLEDRSYIDKEAGVDVLNKGDAFANRFRLTVKGNSFAPPGRTAEFTYHFGKGFWATAEEVFLLGKNRQVLRPPGDTGSVYSWKDKEWRGPKQVIEAFEADPALCREVLAEIYRRDREKTLAGTAPDAT